MKYNKKEMDRGLVFFARHKSIIAVDIEDKEKIG